jgi:hypothetical protein
LKENSKIGPLSDKKIRPIKRIVGTGRSEAKPPISPSSDLGVPSGSEEEIGEGGNKMRMKLLQNVYTEQVWSVLRPRR